MGSPESEPGREPDERPQRVCIEDFALAKYETRVADFRRFVDAEHYQTDAERGTGSIRGCWAFDKDKGDDAWATTPGPVGRRQTNIKKQMRQNRRPASVGMTPKRISVG